MTAERVRLDRSAASVLAVCACGWRELELDAAAAANAGAAHLAGPGHRDGHAAADLRRRNRRRVA